LSFLGWNSDWAYGIDDGGGVVGLVTNPLMKILPKSLDAIPSAKNSRGFNFRVDFFTFDRVSYSVLIVGRANFALGRNLFMEKEYHGL
jgi:hypothetical protein